jgi:transcriptional regulator with XRE-family HTH domain
MTIGGNEMYDYKPAVRRAEVSIGETVRIVRELQEMSQNELARASGIPQSTISAIENGRINLGVERAKMLARALRCHPAVLVFPGWDVEQESAAWQKSA